jgi:hypothetical protein
MRLGAAKFRSRSHDAVIRVYDEAGNVIETNDHAGFYALPVRRKTLPLGHSLKTSHWLQSGLRA